MTTRHSNSWRTLDCGLRATSSISFLNYDWKIYNYIVTGSINCEEANQGSQKKPVSKKPVGKTQDRKSGTGQAPLTSPARTSGARSIRPKFPKIPVQNRMEQKFSGNSFRKFRFTSRGCPFFWKCGNFGNFLFHLAFLPGLNRPQFL